MAKRSKLISAGVEEVGIAIQQPADYNESEQSTVVVVSRFPATIKHTGLSGKLYVWNAPGDAVSVDAQDWPVLKDMRVGKTFCCFGENANYLFELKEA